MKKIFIYTIILFFTFTLKVLSDDKQCNDFKKYSVDYMKCKTNQLKIKTLETGKKIKDKTVSTSKNIIKDTKLVYPASYLKSKNNFLFHSN